MRSVPVEIFRSFIGNKREGRQVSSFKIGVSYIETGIQHSQLDAFTGIDRLVCPYSLNAPGGFYRCIDSNIVRDINYFLRFHSIIGIYRVQQLHTVVIHRHKSYPQFIVEEYICILYPAFTHGFRNKIGRIGNRQAPFCLEQPGSFHHLPLPIPENEQMSSGIKGGDLQITCRSLTIHLTRTTIRCRVIPKDPFS